MKSYKGHILVFLSALLFGSYGIWAVLLGPGFAPMFQCFVRAAIVAVVLGVVLLSQKSWHKVTFSDMKAYAPSVLFALFTQAPLYYAFQHSSVGVASLIFFSVYVITAYIVGYFFLKEEMTLVKVTSCALSVIGLVLIFWSQLGEFSLLALFAAAVGGVASGGEVATTKFIPEKFSTMQTSFIIWTAIAITHAPLSLFLGEKWIAPEFSTPWMGMMCFALAGVLAFWFVIEGYKTVEASIGGLIGLLEVVCAVIFGALVFGESITASIVIGSLVILCAAGLPNVYDRWKSARV